MLIENCGKCTDLSHCEDGLRAESQFAIHISPFAICIFRGTLGPSTHTAPRRLGLSLTETLIAMGILTLGLLGVASLFPVGSKFMQDAEIADRGSMVAQAAMNDLVTSGMLDPARWRVQANLTTVPNAQKPLVYPNGQDSLLHHFSRHLVPVMNDAMLRSASLAPDVRAKNLAQMFGHAYTIDPIGVAATSIAIGNAANGRVSAFPSTASSPPSYWHASWRPWGTNALPGYTWPVRRVTFQAPSGAGIPGNPLNYANWSPTTAEHYFRCRDDLATDLPARDDRAASQAWDTGKDSSNNTIAMARQWTGDYSWIATISTPNSAARDAIANNPGDYSYNVSVAVFYKRRIATRAPATSGEITAVGGPAEMLDAEERVVKASIVSTGLNGGEILLTDLKDGYSSSEASTPARYPQKSPFNNLKVGQWIMLCGPHPLSSDADPRFVLNWYQVMSIDRNGGSLPSSSFDPVLNRIVSLRGPEWPWKPAASLTANDLSNSLCGGIINRVVAVHSRTIRLEGNSAWNAK